MVPFTVYGFLDHGHCLDPCLYGDEGLPCPFIRILELDVYEAQDYLEGLFLTLWWGSLRGPPSLNVRPSGHPVSSLCL